MDKLPKSFEEACEMSGENPSADKFTKGDLDSINYEKLKVVSKVVNAGWKPNWKESDERKWFPVYTDNGSGLVFDGADYCYAHTDVGSRLCYKSREIVLHVVEYFNDLYVGFLS
jgi:hypothetical protein